MTFYDYREFDIVNFHGGIDACAQFTYKGYQISFSTIGRSQGGCPIPVCIFGGEGFKDTVKDGFTTVQEAIQYIDQI